MLDKPTLENPTQLNTKSTKKRKRQSKDSSITDSIPFPSGFPDVTAQKRTEAKESFERYRDLILENIDYDVLASDPHVDREQLDEIVELVQETVCSTRSRIRVAGNDYPAEVVRSKLLKLNSEHIRFVMDCLKQNTTRIRNIRQYLLTALFNAPSTMSSYYAASGGARYGSIVASARILTDLAFQRNVQPALDTIQPYVVVLMHLSGVVDRLPVAC